jgi:hypothetical protein
MSGKQTVTVPVQSGVSREGMTLDQYAAIGFRHQSRGGVDPTADAAATLDQADVAAEISRLDPFIQRDVVSRRRQAFLRRVLDMQGEQVLTASQGVVDAKPVSA